MRREFLTVYLHGLYERPRDVQDINNFGCHGADLLARRPNLPHSLTGHNVKDQRVQLADS